MSADPKAWLRSKLKEHAQENQTAKDILNRTKGKLYE